MSSDSSQPPKIGSQSPGSSVSSSLQNDYDRIIENVSLLPTALLVDDKQASTAAPLTMSDVREQMINDVRGRLPADSDSVSGIPVTEVVASVRTPPSSASLSDESVPREQAPRPFRSATTTGSMDLLADFASGLLGTSPKSPSLKTTKSPKRPAVSSLKSKAPVLTTALLKKSSLAGVKSTGASGAGLFPTKPGKVVVGCGSQRDTAPLSARSGESSSVTSSSAEGHNGGNDNGGADDDPYAEGLSKIDDEFRDVDMGRVNHLLNQWCSELKRNVVAELIHSKHSIESRHRELIDEERRAHSNERLELDHEVENLKQLLATYENSLQRKDAVIANLTEALEKQRLREDKVRTFVEWRAQLLDRRREAFCNQMARIHHERVVKRRVWLAWHSVIADRWRDRLQKACQTKAQEVCIEITNDYEAKLASVEETLAEARTEIKRLQAEREKFEENMKKAFMRGVCALNVEAMGLFQPLAATAVAEAAAAAAAAAGELEVVDDGLDGIGLSPDSIPVQDLSQLQQATYQKPTAGLLLGSLRSPSPSTAAGNPGASKRVHFGATGLPPKQLSARIVCPPTKAASSTASKGAQSRSVQMAAKRAVLVERHTPVDGPK